MPREITYKVYKFDQLSEAAQARAVETVREKLSGPWWDSDDMDAVGYAILNGFGYALGLTTLDAEEGPPCVKLTGWDLDRGRSLSLAGHLDRNNAPALPWVDSVGEILLARDGRETNIGIVGAEEDSEPTEAERDALAQAVREAMHDALKAGDDEIEHRTCDEAAREYIDINEPEFTEGGELHV